MGSKKGSRFLVTLAAVAVILIFAVAWIGLNFGPTNNNIVKPIFLMHDAPDDAAFVVAEAASVANQTITPIQPYVGAAQTNASVALTAPVQAVTPQVQATEANISKSVTMLQSVAPQLGSVYQTYASQHGVSSALNFTAIIVFLGNATKSASTALFISPLSMGTSASHFFVPFALTGGPKPAPVLGAVAVVYNGKNGAFTVVPDTASGIPKSAIPPIGAKGTGPTYTILVNKSPGVSIVRSISTNNFPAASSTFISSLGKGLLAWSQK